jgi:hypothetical protein
MVGHYHCQVRVERLANVITDVSLQSINNLFNLKDLVGKMSLEHCRARKLLPSLLFAYTYPSVVHLRFRRQHSEYSTTAQVMEHENISRMLAAEVKAHDAQVALQREAVKFKDSYNAYKVAEAKAKAAAIKADILKIQAEGAVMRMRDAEATSKEAADAFEAIKVEARQK